jgi:branched-chain amino acid transport system substrate-binding protein
MRQVELGWRRFALVGLSSVLVLPLLTGCGSRLSTEEIRAQGSMSTERSASRSDESGLALIETDDDAGTGDDAGIAAGGPSSRAKASTATSAPVASQGGSTGAKAPIVVGFIGWLSGTGGETIAPVRDAWVVWSRTVNARGGINGHKIQLLVGDHGGNESRALSLARDFVENKGAIVLTTGSGGPAVANYAKTKRVPVVGSILTGEIWNSNPMAFPPYPGSESLTWGGAKLMKRTGKTKLALVYCAESPDCEGGASRMKRDAQKEGLQIVSEMRYSVTAPDYTAECIQMRSAGAEIVYPLGDAGSMIRMAKACSRQSFRPIWVSPTMDDNVTLLPEFEGAIALTPVFPWFIRSGSPGIEEYVAAFQKYAPGRLVKSSIFIPEGWISAKLLEKAAQKVGDKPTSEDILNGLWSLSGETLDGLAPGRAALTFRRDQPTPEIYCIFDARLVGRKWTAPSGLNPICR